MYTETHGNMFRLRLDLFQRFLADIISDLPGAEDMSLLEDLFDLLKSPSNSFGIHEEDVDERCKVEGSEDEVRSPSDGRQAWGYGPSEGGIE